MLIKLLRKIHCLWLYNHKKWESKFLFFISGQKFLNAKVLASYKNKFAGSEFVKRQDSDDDEIALLKRVLSTNDKKDNYEIDTGWLGDNIIYKGSIYIPITNNKLQSITASNMHISERAALQKETEYQMFQKKLMAKQPSASYIQP